MSSKNLTLYISADTATKMEEFGEVNWSKIARDAIETYINDRLEKSIPPELLYRLRKEKGEEYTNGKQHALAAIVPNLTYKNLALFFEKVKRNAENIISDEAEMRGIPDFALSLKSFMNEEALSLVRSYFGKLPKDSTEEFAKGVLSVIDDAWNKLRE